MTCAKRGAGAAPRCKKHNGSMQQGLLPLFPLPLVLLPRTPLALHIFEDRYKEMIGEAIRDRTEFGVVLARDREVLNTGCTAVVDRVLQTYDDGRMDILAGGRRRFEIVSLDQERAFLRGDVEFFDDEGRISETAKTVLRKSSLKPGDHSTFSASTEFTPGMDKYRVRFREALTKRIIPATRD